VDDTRDRSSVVLSVWPQGVKELAMGNRKFVGIGGSLLEE
jgi:predicted Abi (CAAX) family protease